MSAHQFRKLCYFCCATSIVLLGSGIYHYFAQWRWVELMNTPENIALFGRVEFRMPVVMSNVMLVSGLFVALGACFWLKACRCRNSSAEVEDSSVGDEN